MRNSFPIMILIAMVVAGCAEYKVPIAIDKEQHSNQESYFIPGLDHGLIQSPINILSAEIKASNAENPGNGA